MGNKNKFRNENINVNENTNDVQITPETSSVDVNLQEVENVNHDEITNTAGYAEILDNVEPEVVPEEPKYGTVNVHRLNLRSDHSTDSDVIEVLTEGTKVKLEENEDYGNFYKVTVESEVSAITGYCVKEYVTIL